MEDQQITITMADVDVVRQLYPEFGKALTTAAVSRLRAENVQRMEAEAAEASQEAEKQGSKK
jgi:predicted Fe-Mo cluster-binding NifX family protein